ncbi:MAG TPA: hypothetical protein VLG16_00925 [Candidatus Saccharimonadales bacterium]|nr:hypothetical protein [Candidatus Saccharimonadales bacterium]
MKKYYAQIAFALGFGALSFVFLVVALSSTAFLLGWSVSPLWVVASLLGAGWLVYFLLARQGVPKPFLWVGALVVILLACLAFSSATIDPSWDGNSYHKTAVGELAHGWNPVRADVNTFNRSDKNSFKLVGMRGLDRALDTPWVNHYPKASWIFSANIYKITGNIESGKMITPLMIASVFLFAFAALCKRLARNQAIVVSAVLAFNPIIVSQIYSFYVDGIMGNLLIILVLACTMLLDTHARFYGRKLLYAAIFMSAVLAINMKFTGLAYVGIIFACYGLYIIIAHRRELFLKFAGVGTAALLVALALVGASSYLKNTITNGNPLYPLAGKGSVNFITVEEPVGYASMSYVHRFLKSNLAATSQINHDLSLQVGAPRVKVPFSISQSELQTLASTDARQGGYGVWFGGILIVSTLLSLYLVVRYGRQEWRSSWLFVLPLATLAVSVFGVDATWYARYLPQLVMFPSLVVIALYMRKKTVLANTLVFALLFNVTLTAMISGNAQSTFRQQIHQNFAQNLSCGNGQPLKVYSPIGFDGALYNIHDACPNVIVLTPQQAKRVPDQSKVPLFDSIYAVHTN